MKTIGLHFLSFLKEKQNFLKKRLNHFPEQFLVLKQYFPELFSRLFDLRINRFQRKSLPEIFLKNSTMVFSSPEKPNTSPLNKIDSGFFANQNMTSDFLPKAIDQSVQQNEIIGPNTTHTNETNEIKPQIIEKISNFLNLRLPKVFIHRNIQASEYLRKYNAEAMTIGQHIYVRNENSDLTTRHGMALLGHELTHVAQENEQGDQTPGFSQSTSKEVQEKTALRNERLILHHAPLSFQTSNKNVVEQVQAATVNQTSKGSTGPHFAEESRDISTPLSDPALTESTRNGLSNGELKQIKEEVYHDILMRIKTEFERGG